MSGIINVMKNITYIISLVMFYGYITTNPTKFFRVLSCVLYFVIEDYVCIDYIYCLSKIISVVSCDK